MRKRGRTDANQQPIIDALRSIGCSVVDLSAVGGGVLDLLVGFRRINIIMEVKDGDKPPSKRKLTPAQVDFFREWRGQATVVNSPKEAVEYVLAHTGAQQTREQLEEVRDGTVDF